MVTTMTVASEVDEELVRQFELVKEVIINIRAIRQQKGISPKEKLSLLVINDNSFIPYYPVLIHLGNLFDDIKVVDKKTGDSISFMVGITEFAIPLQELFGVISIEDEIKKMEAELKHKEGFLQGVLKKLSNEKFVNNAPAAVIELERKKQADAESIISSLKESIASLRAKK